MRQKFLKKRKGNSGRNEDSKVGNVQRLVSYLPGNKSLINPVNSGTSSNTVISPNPLIRLLSSKI